MPEISREMLEAQIATMQAQKQRATEDIHAINGAIQLAEWLLTQLDKTELTPDGAAKNGDQNDGK